MSEIDEGSVERTRDWKRIATIGGLILLAAIFSFLNADERIAINVGFTVLYRLSLVGVVFTVFVLGMLTMFLFGLRHDRAVRDALRSQLYRQPLQGRPLARPLPVQSSSEVSDEPELLYGTPPPPVPDPLYEPGAEQAFRDDPPEPQRPA